MHDLHQHVSLKRVVDSAAIGANATKSGLVVDRQMFGGVEFILNYGAVTTTGTIVNRAGTSVIRDNITAKGTTKFNFRRRFGGGITHFEAIKLMKFATS